MIYSVWNWDKAQYDYYDAPGPGLGVKPPPRRVGTPSQGGQKLETVLTVVPSGARPAGAGEAARGRIAVLGNDPDGINSAPRSPVVWLFTGIALYGLGYWVIAKLAGKA